MILLIDQDGPLADFDTHFYALCAERGWALHDGAATAETPCTEHRFLSDCPSTGGGKAARLAVESPGWFRSLPVVDGCVDGLNELLAHPDVDDVFICTKPLEASPTCRDEKAAWVRAHLGKAWERRLILTPDKSVVHGAILLDDAPKAAWYGSAGRATWKPVLYPTSWNHAESAWGNLPTWTWGEPVEDLLWLA